MKAKPRLRQSFHVGDKVIHKLFPDDVGTVTQAYVMRAAAGNYRLKYSVYYPLNRPPKGIRRSRKNAYGLSAENGDLKLVTAR